MRMPLFLALLCGLIATPAFAQYQLMPGYNTGTFQPTMAQSQYANQAPVQQYMQYAVPAQSAPVAPAPMVSGVGDPMMSGGQQYQWQLVPVGPAQAFAQPAFAAPVQEALPATPIVEAAPVVEAAPAVAAPIVEAAPVFAAPAPAPQVVFVQAPAPAPIPAPAPQIVFVPTPAPPVPAPMFIPPPEPMIIFAPAPRRKGCCLFGR